MTLALHEAHELNGAIFSGQYDAWAGERTRLVRLCARLTGDAAAADGDSLVATMARSVLV